MSLLQSSSKKLDFCALKSDSKGNTNRIITCYRQISNLLLHLRAQQIKAADVTDLFFTKLEV